MCRVRLKPVYQCRPEDLTAFPELRAETVQGGMRERTRTGPDDEDRSKLKETFVTTIHTTRGCGRNGEGA
jgi:hypothetical protein